MRKGIVLLVLVAMLSLVVSATSAQDVKTITWWTEDYVDFEALNTLLVEPFNAQHPDIRLEIIPQSGLDDAVRTAFTAGSAPDILQTPGASFIGEYVNAGLIHPLTQAEGGSPGLRPCATPTRGGILPSPSTARASSAIAGLSAETNTRWLRWNSTRFTPGSAAISR